MYILLATVLVFIFTLLFVLNWQKHSFWKWKGVTCPPAIPFIGHMHKTFTKNKWIKKDQLYREFKSTGYWGMYEFFKPTFCVADPALLRSMFVKDNDHFVDRRVLPLIERDKLFHEMLHIQSGEKWKSLRTLISPTFSSGKIKAMFPLIASKCDNLLTQCEKEMSKNHFIEMKSLLGYYALDVIGTCAFGIEVGSLKKKEDSAFVTNANDVSKLKWKTMVKLVISMASPKIYNALQLSFSGDSMKFFENAVQETINIRKKSGEKRGDFLDLMLEATEESKENGKNSNFPVTNDTVIAQAILFLLAGFDTTANSLSFVVYLLAKNEIEQERLRKELLKLVETDGELTYQNVMEAEFLDACISETLRMYSPAHELERTCTKQYNIPGTDITLEEGIVINFPAWSLHYDPEYWEEPESFLPDRFLPENKDRIKPYTYLPFGFGPRNCIGMRFALLETKMAVAMLILNFKMELRPGFKEMTLDSGPGTLRPNKDGVQLVLEKLTPN